MRILLDRQSSVPLYRQIERYLRQAILSGGLPPGTRLPSGRTLARDLGINRITVETALAALIDDGLVEMRPGSGAYVLAPAPQPLPHPERASWRAWQASPAAPALQPPAAQRPACIDLSVGLGDTRLFPAADFRKTLQQVMRRDGPAALEYGDPAGYTPLRQTIAGVLASQGLQAPLDSLLVTSGSQQGLALAALLLARPGDRVLVENPTYAGALDLFRALGLTLIPIPVDADGMQTDRLEELLRQHSPRLVYSIPNFQNPTGVCLSLARRRTLVALAQQYGATILEDDFVGDLRFEGRALPSLKALDPGGVVIYASTFSKMLMPGLRVGFLVSDRALCERLTALKRSMDMATSNLTQRALQAYVTIGRYAAHLHRSCRVFRKRRDTLLAAALRHLPGAECRTPQGGLFVWLRLPDGISAQKLLPQARAAGIDFAPGSGFYVDARDGDRFTRLNFAAHTAETLEEGIRRLGQAVRLAEAVRPGQAVRGLR